MSMVKIPRTSTAVVAPPGPATMPLFGVTQDPVRASSRGAAEMIEKVGSVTQIDYDTSPVCLVKISFSSFFMCTSFFWVARVSCALFSSQIR